MPVSGLRLDLHNHTHFSADGIMSPAALLKTAKARGIDCLAVTDHNTTDGALQALELAREDPSLPRVIPGIELSTADGEIIGLYVWETIPSGLPLLEATARIRGQGGLIYLPHPYDFFRRGAISRRARALAGELADIIEVSNGRSLGPGAGVKAAGLARRLGKPAGAGSDAHREAEVGLAYTVVGTYPSRDTLVSLVAAGSVRSGLCAREYTLNWGMQGLAPMTRMRRRVIGDPTRK
jgi:predicted metal-dependent phosphoesterase TrpH